ncbi:CPBP family intramembrane glutamic endopeptidase [Streptococcus pluranimalium]|uniref:CPBP family intramembrane glutamic endopeptidase n=1 Tax=Streptococcus pluranimalium TaxID=82348 RepID=UPI0039FBA4D6
MNFKHILTHHFERYRKWPTWALVLLGCGLVECFFIAGGFLFELARLLFLVLGILTIGQSPLLDTIANSLHVELLAFAFTAGLLFAWVKWVEKRPLITLGFYKDNRFRELLLGFGVGALQFSLSLLVVFLLGGSQFKGVDFSSTSLLFVLSIIPFWMIQGGTEELLTRAWLLPLINSRLGIAIAIGISSFLFGLMHMGNDHITIFAFLDLLLSGIGLALFMLYRDNIWSVMGLHASWNFVQGNIYGIEVSGSDASASLFRFASNPQAPTWLSGGHFGIEGSLITCLVEIAFIIVILYLMKKQKADKHN